MTIINLLTQGQQLINASKVVVASGDVNSVELQVEFDSVAWGEYPVRSATFYTSKDATVHEMLLLNDKCIVPFEVLTEASVLFIGVRGVSADGERVKTSSLVKYKISEGAPIGDKTLTPTMDLYQQYLAAVKAEADPVIAAIKEEIKATAEAEIATMRENAEELNASVHETASELVRTVLWENPDATAVFPATTIEMDLSAFQSFRVVYANSNKTAIYGHGEMTISVKGIRYSLQGISLADDLACVFRGITISDTGIVIEDGVVPYESASEANNRYAVPVQIIGYKY